MRGNAVTGKCGDSALNASALSALSPHFLSPYFRLHNDAIARPRFRATFLSLRYGTTDAVVIRDNASRCRTTSASSRLSVTSRADASLGTR
jgi:hypothetical protein